MKTREEQIAAIEKEYKELSAEEKADVRQYIEKLKSARNS